MTYEVIDWRTLRMDGDEQHCKMVLAMCNGYRLYDPETSAVFRARVSALPTQCGGRYISIQCDERTLDVSYIINTHATYGDGRTWFPCGANGLLAIVAELPCDVMRELRDQMLVYREMLHNQCGKYCEMAHPNCPITPAPADKDWTRYAWVIALADIDAHNGESCDDGEGECEECGGLVYACDDGYCEDCDWHTYVGYGEVPEEDYNQGLSGEPDNDYADYEPHSYDLEIDEEKESRWHAMIWEAGNSSDGVRRLMTYVNAEVECFDSVESMKNEYGQELPMDKFIEKYVLPVCLWQGPVFLSSNVAEPEYATAHLIAALRQASALLRTYGLRLLAPDHFATNPNERNHYVDGIMIVGVDTCEMFSTYRRSLSRNNW